MHPSRERFQFVQCPDCELVALNPRVAPEKLGEYYTDYYLPYRGPQAWGKYQKQVANSQVKLDRSRVKLLAQHHPIERDSTILDLGCGKPTFLQQCVRAYQCRAVGIDFSDEGWKHQVQDFASLELHVGEVDDLSADLRPDVITMWHYLEHDYDPLSTLKKLKAIAQEKTTMIIEVPNYASESRKRYGEHWAGYHTPRHTFLFSPDNLTRLLQKAGWSSVQVNTFGTLDPYVLYWMSEMERKGIDWSINMEKEFFGYVTGLLRFLPKRINSRRKSLGIMTAIAKL